MNELSHLLTPAQWAGLRRRSTWRGLWAIGFNWIVIAAAFALAIAWPTWPGVALAMTVLGGRQLGLAILMHDCAHRSLMASPEANEELGQWLCAAPVFVDLQVYRQYHMTHHRETGTDCDPDLPNYSRYPVTARSLARKLMRDLLGATGLKAALALGMLYRWRDPTQVGAGYSYRFGAASQGEAAGQASIGNLFWNLRRVLVAQAAMAGLLWGLGHPLAYLLWPASWLTTNMLFSRIRNAAEHGGLPGTMSTDPWLNTRSVRARWWERLTVAPNHVNWHFEHHLAPTVPGYRLADMHRLLADRAPPRALPVVHGYGSVMRSLIRRA